MIARQSLRAARPLARLAARPTARRSYASAPSQPHATGSDTPWAIASALGFGGLFLYLTAPGPKSDSRTDHNARHGADNRLDEPKQLPDGSIEHPEGFVEVKRPVIRDDAPAGDKHLDSISLSDDHAYEKELNKPKRTPSLPHDNTTFQHGLAAAKDGNPISDPKKVVAAAHAEKEEKANAKAASS
ncbi:hypothetical protein ACQY0O_008387 [Thecaphora frezii]